MSEEKKSSNESEQLTLFQEDSLAKTSRLRTQTEKESLEAGADFGRKCLGSFAKYDHDLSLWKTSQTCLEGGLESFSETWPRSGTMRNGNVCRHQPLAHLTREIDCGFFPTPVSSDATTGAIIGKNDRFYQTKGLPRKVNKNGKDGSVGLARLIKLWATPDAWNGKRGGQDSEKMETSGHQVTLNDLVKKNLGMKKLHPSFVEWMMGVPFGWTDLNCLETAKSFRLSNGSENK